MATPATGPPEGGQAQLVVSGSFQIAGYGLEKGEKLPTGGVMDRYARRVEALIRERPADWLWTYKRWKVKRSVYA